MTRVVVIAVNEFLALVRTKFFLVGVLIVPVAMGLLMAFMNYAGRQADRTDRHFAVVDQTGVLYEPIADAAREHNAQAGQGRDQNGPRFFPELVAADGRSAGDLEATLSDRVRRRELLGFVVLPASALDPASTEPVQYFTENTAYRRLESWLEPVVSNAIAHRRLEAAGLDAALVARLTTGVSLVPFNLLERRPDGSIVQARPVDAVQSTAVPVFFLVVMFMAIMSNAQHLIHAIIEEKMSKISEVLLGSVSAFQLLMGKLLGIVGVSLTLSAVYLAGGTYALVMWGRPDLIDVRLVGWFLLFLVCASLMFGSLFEALSSACSDLKDAQSMLQPAMMMLIAAYLASATILRSPDSTMATVLSLVPPITPFAMVLRLAMPPGPPLWQVLLGVALLIAATVGTVWAAGRVFRIGLLMQGKPPNLPELLRWIRQ